METIVDQCGNTVQLSHGSEIEAYYDSKIESAVKIVVDDNTVKELNFHTGEIEKTYTMKEFRVECIANQFYEIATDVLVNPQAVVEDSSTARYDEYEVEVAEQILS